jgi:hypothetical protein
MKSTFKRIELSCRTLSQIFLAAQKKQNKRETRKRVCTFESMIAIGEAASE